MQRTFSERYSVSTSVESRGLTPTMNNSRILCIFKITFLTKLLTFTFNLKSMFENAQSNCIIFKIKQSLLKNGKVTEQCFGNAYQVHGLYCCGILASYHRRHIIHIEPNGSAPWSQNPHLCPVLCRPSTHSLFLQSYFNIALNYSPVTNHEHEISFQHFWDWYDEGCNGPLYLYPQLALGPGAPCPRVRHSLITVQRDTIWAASCFWSSRGFWWPYFIEV
jgi:hypothetical protein